MKVVGFNGSPRPEGNTAALIRRLFAELERAGIETELVQLGGRPVRGCTACRRCYENRDRRCVLGDDDGINAAIGRMAAADGIVIGSPTYFADVTAETKALIDRAGYVARANDHLLARKVGVAVTAVRRAGAIHVLDTIQHFFNIGQVIVPGSIYWGIGFGRNPGDVEDDAEGEATMDVLGKNMAWLLEKLHR